LEITREENLLRSRRGGRGTGAALGRLHPPEDKTGDRGMICRPKIREPEGGGGTLKR